jgi:TP53 regulating kinase-like protein
MHDNGIVYSDLTTSNIMLHDGKIRFIDFGLSYISNLAEDKAVDLYVMGRAFNSSHLGHSALLELIFEGYKSESKNLQQIMRRLEKVRKRGRKRSMVG